MPPLDVNEARVDELGDVVGQQGLLDVEQRPQLALADRLAVPAQHVEDVHPHRLGERLRDGGDALGIEGGVQSGRRGATCLGTGSGGFGGGERSHIN